MSSEKPYSSSAIKQLRAAGFKQGKTGSFGYDIIKRGNDKIIQIHGSLSPKIK